MIIKMWLLLLLLLLLLLQMLLILLLNYHAKYHHHKWGIYFFFSFLSLLLWPQVVIESIMHSGWLAGQLTRWLASCLADSVDLI